MEKKHQTIQFSRNIYWTVIKEEQHPWCWEYACPSLPTTSASYLVSGACGHCPTQTAPRLPCSLSVADWRCSSPILAVSHQKSLSGTRTAPSPKAPGA